MYENIINQIQNLQELRNKCLEVCGYYGHIDTAIAALEICNNYGLDVTARFISDLRSNGIKTNEDLRNLISNNDILKPKQPIISDEILICPKCSNTLNNGNYCSNCGQKIIK